MLEDNLETRRRNSIAEIKRHVDVAFQNRRAARYSRKTNSFVEISEEQRDTQKKLALMKPDEIVQFMPFSERPSLAYVTHSHEYPDLLLASLQKLADANLIQKRDIQALCKQLLEHELLHQLGMLGVEGVTIRYCVEFLEDPNTHFIALQPFLSFEGKINKTVFLEAIDAPNEKSHGDKTLLTQVERYD